MTTVINNPPTENKESSAPWIIIIVLIVLGLLYFYGLPAIRGENNDANLDVNVSIPNGDNGQ